MSLNPKAVCRSEAFLRVTGQPPLPAATAASFALSVAAAVLPAFERACPDDDRVRRALDAVAPFASGKEISSNVTARAVREVTEVLNNLRAAWQTSFEERQRLGYAFEAASVVCCAAYAVDAAMTDGTHDVVSNTRAAILRARNAGLEDGDIDRIFAALMQALMQAPPPSNAPDGPGFRR